MKRLVFLVLVLFLTIFVFIARDYKVHLLLASSTTRFCWENPNQPVDETKIFVSLSKDTNNVYYQESLDPNIKCYDVLNNGNLSGGYYFSVIHMKGGKKIKSQTIPYKPSNILGVP